MEAKDDDIVLDIGLSRKEKTPLSNSIMGTEHEIAKISAGEVGNKMKVKEIDSPEEESFVVPNPILTIANETMVCNDAEGQSKMKIKEEGVLDGLQNKRLPTLDSMKVNNNNPCGAFLRVEIKEEPWCYEETSTELESHPDSSCVSDLQVYSEIMDGTNEDFPAAESRLHKRTASSISNSAPYVLNTSDLEKKDSLKCGNDSCEFTRDNANEIIISDVLETSCTEQTLNFCKTKTDTINNCDNNIEKVYVCEVCDKSFAHANALKLHFLRHTQSGLKTQGKRQYTCDICDKTFIQMASLKCHLLLHKGIKPYKCAVCEKSFTQLGDLKRHLLIHQGKRPFKCDVCEKSFTQTGDLKRHILIHQGKRLFKCDICEKSLTRMGDLKRHIMIHDGVKPFKCEICEKAFTQKTSLNLHILIHQGKRPFKCEICEKSFTQKGHLSAHHLIHLGDRPYECDVCGKTFNQKLYLKNHILVHQGKRPYKCEVCEKTFTQKTTLKNHTLIHEGKKPYKCNVCKKNFTQIGHLNKHILIHEPKMPYMMLWKEFC